MATFLYENPVFLEHKVPEGHPERPDRLRALNLALEHPNFAELKRIKAPRGSEELVLLAHPEDHLRSIVREIPRKT